MSTVELSKSKTEWPRGLLLRRGFWTFVLQPLVRWLPKSFSPLRIWALRAMGAQIGPHCLVLPGVSVLMPWNLVLDDHVAVGRGVNFYNFAPVRVRRMTVVSQDTYLCTGSHDFNDPHMPLTYQPIDIGSECWVAAGVFVGPGVTVPDGVVIGARAVVPKSLSTPWAIYAGNPCRQVGRRQLRGRPTPQAPVGTDHP